MYYFKLYSFKNNSIDPLHYVSFVFIFPPLYSSLYIMNIGLLIEIYKSTTAATILCIIKFYRKLFVAQFKEKHQTMKRNIIIQYEEWLFLRNIDHYLMPILLYDCARELIDISHFMLHKPIINMPCKDLAFLHIKSKKFLLLAQSSGSQYESMESSILLYIRHNEIKSHTQFLNLYRLLERSPNWNDLIIYYIPDRKYAVHLYHIFVSLVCYIDHEMTKYETIYMVLIMYAKNRCIGQTFYDYTSNFDYLFTKEENDIINRLYLELKS